jgi:hypothetical protein
VIVIENAFSARPVSNERTFETRDVAQPPKTTIGIDAGIFAQGKINETRAITIGIAKNAEHTWPVDVQ